MVDAGIPIADVAMPGDKTRHCYIAAEHVKVFLAPIGLEVQSPQQIIGGDGIEALTVEPRVGAVEGDKFGREQRASRQRVHVNERCRRSS